MSTITMENVAAVPVPEDEPTGTPRAWVTQSPLVTLAACASTFFLYLSSRRTA